VGADHLAIPQAQDALIPAAPECKGDILLVNQERTVHKYIDIAEDFLAPKHLVDVSAVHPDIFLRHLPPDLFQQRQQHTLVLLLAGFAAEYGNTLYP